MYLHARKFNKSFINTYQCVYTFGNHAFTIYDTIICIHACVGRKVGGYMFVYNFFWNLTFPYYDAQAYFGYITFWIVVGVEEGAVFRFKIPYWELWIWIWAL